MRLLPLVVALAACAPSLEDATFPTGSSTAAVSRDGAHLLTLDADSGQIVRTDVATGAAVDALTVGGEPARIAPIGASGRFAVTQRASRSLVVVDTVGGLAVEATVDVGTEPVAVVSTEDGSRLYVAASTQDEVIELDGASLAELRRFRVAGEPRWLALRPGGHALYVMPAFGGEPSWIDLDDGAVTPVEMPDVGPYTVRLTGDPAVSADGTWLVLPALYVDNFTEERADSLGTSLYYANPGKWNPVLVAFSLGAGGAPGDQAIVSYVTAQGDEGVIGSYAAAVVLDPNLPMAWAALEGSDVVVASNFVERSKYGGPDGIRRTSLVVRHTGPGPTGLAFAGDRGFVHTALDHAVQPIDGAEVRADLAERVGGVDAGYLDPAARLTERFEIAAPTLGADVELGRRLFYSATDSAIVLPGSGVSCATCHFEGRNDGLTWPLAAGPRQTPSLAGKVSDTAPVTWTQGVASVAHEVGLTSSNRMGGGGLGDAELAAIAAYVDHSRDVDLPLKGSDDPAVARGKALFERGDVGCAGCHRGPAFTDNQNHRAFGLAAVDTPTLRGIAATAPYLHDGRFATLTELLGSLDGQMGDTSMLSDAERADLEAWLRSL